MTLNPDEEAALCRESSRLRDAAWRRLDGETVATGFTPPRKARRTWRRRKRRNADDGSAPGHASTVPGPTSAPTKEDPPAPPAP